MQPPSKSFSSVSGSRHPTHDLWIQASGNPESFLLGIGGSGSSIKEHHDGVGEEDVASQVSPRIKDLVSCLGGKLEPRDDRRIGVETERTRGGVIDFISRNQRLQE